MLRHFHDIMKFKFVFLSTSEKADKRRKKYKKFNISRMTRALLCETKIIFPFF